MTSWVLRTLGTAAALALVLFALVAERTRERGARWIEDSDRAFDAGRMELAVQHARAAATAYVPGAEHVRLGYARLRAVARGAQRARDIELSAAAWRAMRAAAIESRHVWQPHEDELREADRELSHLVHSRATGVPSPGSAGLSASVSCALVLGAACAAVGLWALFGQEAPEAGEGRWPRLRLPALLCLLGIATWSAALLRA
jgi:HAMP domain-containing protein